MILFNNQVHDEQHTIFKIRPDSPFARLAFPAHIDITHKGIKENLCRLFKCHAVCCEILPTLFRVPAKAHSAQFELYVHRRSIANVFTLSIRSLTAVEGAAQRLLIRSRQQSEA